MFRRIAVRSLLCPLAVVASVAGLDAMSLAAGDAHAARPTPLDRTVARGFRLDVSAVRRYTFSQTIPHVDPKIPAREILDGRRFEWSGSSAKVVVTAVRRRKRWRDVALQGGATFVGHVDTYDSTLHTLSPVRLDPYGESYGTCTTDVSTILDGESSIRGALGGTVRPLRLHAGITSATASLNIGRTSSTCPDYTGKPGRTYQAGLMGEPYLDALPLARRRCKGSGSFDSGWTQDCTYTKTRRPLSGGVITESLRVEIRLRPSR